MTAMSALRASASEPVPSTALDLPGGENRPAVRVLIPGTDRTYENRDVLRGLGLCWDPPTHAWHGALTSRQRTFLRERFGLAVRPVVALESFPATVETPPSPPKPPQGPSPSLTTAVAVTTSRVTHDGSRTHVEARLALKDAPDELADPWEALYGRCSLLDVTSGLPDDSREADERQAARHLRDLRGRVKAAPAVIATTRSLDEILVGDPRRASMFRARFGVTEERLRRAVPPSPDAEVGLNLAEYGAWSFLDESAHSSDISRGEV